MGSNLRHLKRAQFPWDDSFTRNHNLLSKTVSIDRSRPFQPKQ